MLWNVSEKTPRCVPIGLLVHMRDGDFQDITVLKEKGGNLRLGKW